MAEKIVLAQPVHKAVVARLRQVGNVEMNAGPDPFRADELAGRCREASALMAFMTERVDDAFLQQCPKLKIVAGALKGYDNIDVDACSRRGVAVSIVPDLLTEPTAELALALMISVARNLGPAERHVRSGQFRGWRPTYFGTGIAGATVGVIGAGKLGQAILRLLSGFEAEKLYADRARLPLEREEALKATFTSVEDICRRADYVVLALPLTAKTLGLVNRDFLELMRPEAFLINPARGSLVSEAAIAEALDTGRLAGYAADVFEFEDWARNDRPHCIEPRLLASAKTVLTPHLGSAVTEVRRQITQSAADSILAVLGGRLPETVINEGALSLPA